MGVLDDAIREHLELKRQHGVPDEELRRQEEEALGPARREITLPEGGETAGVDEMPAEMPETAVEDTAEPVAEDTTEPAAEDAAGQAAEPARAPFDGETPRQTPPQQAGPGADGPEPGLRAGEPEPDEAAPAVPHPAEPAEPLSGLEEPEGTAEPEADRFEPPPEPSVDRPPEGPRRFERESYPTEGGPGGDPSPAEDDEAVDQDVGGESEKKSDVLEDTPDFLEESPEHDRLWFEQKPPRDFDFD
jgi:hypothetical protein